MENNKAGMWLETRMKVVTGQRTFITHEQEVKFNAPHDFLVHSREDNRIISHIHFQEGPIKEAGLNGIMNEDLLHMVRLRLEGFQNSEFKCEENQVALDHVVKALESLESRTKKRVDRGVEGTHVV